MFSKIYSAGINGIDGFIVTVECSANKKMPMFEIVGLPDTAVKEAKERVTSASENSGVRFPDMALTVNLAPADKKKEGSALDLAILLSIFASSGIFNRETSFDGKCFVGELSLSGDVRPVRGVLSMCTEAKARGFSEIYVPFQNAAEASCVKGIKVFGVKNIRQLLALFNNNEPIEETKYDDSVFMSKIKTYPIDFSDVKGQNTAKRAMEIAATGGHNILLIGPPGTGKSMLAKRLPTILPPLSFDEAIETTKIYSVAGMLGENETLMYQRPFRSPHHTMSAISLVGGGANPRPGEVSLSDNGVLFLDELPEFQKSVTDTLRQPLEDGKVTITRAIARTTFPCNFMLVCAMNPCRCGYFGHPTRKCTCKPEDVRKYISKISGPLLDRIDIQIELPSITYDEISNTEPSGETSAVIRERVIKAREFAHEREKNSGLPIKQNANLDSKEIRKYCIVEEDAKILLNSAYDKLGLSARGYDRLMRVARTIADLDASETIKSQHIAEAIQLRSLDKKYWG